MKPLAVISAATIALFPVPPASASWANFTFRDEWGEDANIGARSALTTPAQPLPWPYNDLKARLYVDGCDSAWVRFTSEPNLTGGSIGSIGGHVYQTYYVKARANGKEVTEPMMAWLGDKDLSWRSDDAAVIEGWANEESYEILIPLYQHRRVWKFDMTGAKAAIAKTCPSATN